MDRLVNYGNLLTPDLDRDTIEKALKRLDDRLFLDPEVDVSQTYLFWTVKYHVAGDQPPVLILEWREPPQGGHIGEPRELNYNMIEEVKRREGGSEGAVARAVAKNRERQERIDREKRDRLEETTAEMAERMRPTRSAVLPRSQGLRRSRDKARAAGKKV